MLAFGPAVGPNRSGRTGPNAKTNDQYLKRGIGSNTEKKETNTEKMEHNTEKKNRRSNDINFEIFQWLDLLLFFQCSRRFFQCCLPKKIIKDQNTEKNTNYLIKFILCFNF